MSYFCKFRNKYKNLKKKKNSWENFTENYEKTILFSTKSTIPSSYQKFLLLYALWEFREVVQSRLPGVCREKWHVSDP